MCDENREPMKENLLEDWHIFYQRVFGIEADLSKLRVPEQRKGFGRLIVVLLEMTPECLFQKCKELFPCWKWTDQNLDEIVKSERASRNGTYAVWFRDRVEADEEFKNLSVNQLKKQNIPGITLEERLLMDIKYFKETGKHLDIRNVTLCSGSRYSDGNVPDMNWLIDRLCVEWDDPDDCYSYLRTREAVL